MASRRRERLALATRLAASVIDRLEMRGIKAAVIGSLISGKFDLHSDVDFLISKGQMSEGRRQAELLIGETFARSGISTHIVFEDDLDEKLQMEFARDRQIFGDIRNAAPEARQS